MNDLVYCPDHRDNCKKISDLCSKSAVIESRVSSCEFQYEQINAALYGSGGSDTIKSRLQRNEDAVSGLQTLVLENRDVVKETMSELRKESDKKLEGLFKIFVLTISGISCVLILVFSVMWSELKDVSESIASIQQIRQPSPSPMLPFKHSQVERP